MEEIEAQYRRSLELLEARKDLVVAEFLERVGGPGCYDYVDKATVDKFDLMPKVLSSSRALWVRPNGYRVEGWRVLVLTHYDKGPEWWGSGAEIHALYIDEKGNLDQEMNIYLDDMRQASENSDLENVAKDEDFLAAIESWYLVTYHRAYP